MTRRYTKRAARPIPLDPGPAVPVLVWDRGPTLTIETVTVHRRIFRETGNGGARVANMAISLPRVKFLEDVPAAPPTVSPTADTANSDEDDFAIAA